MNISNARTFVAIKYLAIGAFTLLSAVVHAAGDLFSLPIQDVRLETDFSSLFKDEALAIEGFTLPGVFYLKANGREWKYDVDVSARGNTSRYDCSFKKLALKISNQGSGPLAGIQKLRLNTHCSDSKTGYTEMGRVAGPSGPIREGAVYDWMNILKLPTYRSVVTPITYVNTATKEITKSFALILDSKKDLKFRLQNSKVYEEEDLDELLPLLDRASETAENQVTIKGLLLNAIIENADFSLQLKDKNGERQHNPISPPSGMWNMLVIDYTNRVSFVPTDFDVSGIVRQSQYLSNPTLKAISNCFSATCEFQFAQLQKWRAFFSADDLNTAIAEIHKKSKEMKNSVLQNKNLQAKEKKYFINSLVTFMKVSQSYASVPVIANSTRVFLDAELTTACGMENKDDGYVIFAPEGLPVKHLAAHKESFEVLLIDTRDGVLSNPNGGSCEGRVFLPKETLIDTNWPK